VQNVLMVTGVTPPALLLGFALPGQLDLIAATQLLAGAVR
jgi:hypothetical protein